MGEAADNPPSWSDWSHWSNGPGDRYGAHDHAYEKELECLEGSIDFHLGDGRVIALGAGERMVLPARTAHSAVVGPSGCRCRERHRDVS